MSRPDDLDLIGREPGMPGLSTLLCDQQMRAHLDALRLGTVRGLKATYLRYKPHANCLVSFQATIDGQERFLYGIAYDSQVASDKLDSAQRFLQQDLSAIGHVDRAQQMALYFFPFDRKLLQLPTVHSADWLNSLGGNEPTTAEVLSYKPLRRSVSRVDVHGEPRFVLRCMIPEHYANAKSVLKRLPDLSLMRRAKAAHHSDRQSVLVMPWLAGQRLSQFNGAAFLQEVRRLASVMAELHRHCESQLAIQMPADSLGQLRGAIEMAGALVPSAVDELEAIGVSLERQFVHQVRRCAVLHGDVHADQVLVGDDFTLLDWDRATNGDPERDLASFLAHEFVFSDQGVALPNMTEWETTYEALVSEYERTGQIQPSRLAAYLALELLKVAVMPFRRRMKDWAQRAQATIQLATRFADESQRTKLPIVSVANTSDLSSSPAVPQDEPWLSPALDAAVAAPWIVAQLSPMGELALDKTELLQYKPERRALVRYRLFGTHVAGEITALAKVRRKGADLRAADIQAKLFERLHGDSSASLVVARPLGIVPRLNLWLQAPLPGTNATTAIRPDSDPAISGRIGRALRELHCLNVPANLTHAHADELSILQGLLQGVAEKKKSMAADITAVMEGVSSALGRFPTKSVTGIHRDFYPAQVLIAGDDKVAFVDFDLFCVGDPLIDVGNFVAHLKETALREYHDADALQHHESRFLTSYCGSAESVDDQAAAIDAHVLVSLARHIFISRRIAARKQITQPIIELCLRLIGEHQDRFHTTNAAL